MILDSINNLFNYRQLIQNLAIVAEYLERNPLETMPEGRYELQGTDAYILIVSYQTKYPDEVKWEAHRKYMDIQYVLDGSENMGWMPESQLDAKSDYSDEKDVIFYENKDEASLFIEVKKGCFAIFLPSDAHKPSCLVEEPKRIKKAIIKVPIRYLAP